MKKHIASIQLLFILTTAFLFAGCQAIGDIFKAGMWSGILIVVLIIGVILYLVSRGSRKE
jgi:uncharacterized membrane protein YkvI